MYCVEHKCLILLFDKSRKRRNLFFHTIRENLLLALSTDLIKINYSSFCKTIKCSHCDIPSRFPLIKQLIINIFRKILLNRYTNEQIKERIRTAARNLIICLITLHANYSFYMVVTINRTLHKTGCITYF